VFDKTGNIYGTTLFGGRYGDGTVFEIAAPGQGPTEESILWSFNGDDGIRPTGSLILDGAGDLYGTTQYGGSSANGVVFEVTP